MHTRRVLAATTALALQLSLARGLFLGSPRDEGASLISGFAHGTLDAVKANLAAIATHSWEIGTQTEALLEWEWPQLSVFGATSVPDHTFKNTSQASDVFAIVQRVVSARAAKQQTFWVDGAAGDPASIGVATLLANWTNPSSTPSSNASVAASNQLNYLLYSVPHAQNGAISHRTDQVQFWADSVSMVPPFLAYYGAVTANMGLLAMSYNQIAAYRTVLIDPFGSGLWRHIVVGNYEDTGLWATGNAWAAYGMLRTAHTLQSSIYGFAYMLNVVQLRDWALEIVQNAWKHQQASGAILNYLDGKGTGGAQSVFEDTSATALLAASTFRVAVMVASQAGSTGAVPVGAAVKARSYVISKVSGEGWVEGVVDPMDWTKAGEKSPEAQAFVLMMEAAYRDWQDSLVNPNAAA